MNFEAERGENIMIHYEGEWVSRRFFWLRIRVRSINTFVLFGQVDYVLLKVRPFYFSKVAENGLISVNNRLVK